MPPALPQLAPNGIVIGGFVLDAAGHRLTRDGTPVRLRPQTWRVLCYLVERAGRLVTREELLRDVWEGAAVSDDTLTQSIGELRRAFGDSARSPRFIETVHRLGFRFIALPDERPAALPTLQAPTLPSPSPATAVEAALDPAAAFVGRTVELAHLHGLLDQARAGKRQIVLVGGETGIGKTSLVERFLRGTADAPDARRVLRGQCVQQYGQREPYMPVLDAIETAARGPGGAELVQLLQRVAPRVYDILTRLHPEAAPAAASGTPSSERVLREMAALLEAAAADSPLVLVLEDLHWSDAATMDLLSVVSQRREPARLLLIGTFRPADAALQGHPIRELRHSLRRQRRESDLALGYLGAADVEAYLQLRFGLRDPALAGAMHERTDGHPLFFTTLVDDMVRAGALREVRGGWAASLPAERAVPADLRDVIAAQLHGLDAGDRVVLETASVAGVRFEPELVAAAVTRDHEDVEAVCDRLVRSHVFLQKPSASPASASVAEYEFTHALQHQVIYEQIPVLRRRRLHRTIAEALEAGHGDHVEEHASQLAMHHERAGQLDAAVAHLARCVVRAQQRGAHREAATFVEEALRLLDGLPADDARDQRELQLRLLLGVSLNVTYGYAASEVRMNFARARALCERAGDERQLFEVMSAFWYVQIGHGDVAESHRNVEVLAAIADRLDDAELRRRVLVTRGRTEFLSGRFPVAVSLLGDYIEQARRAEPGTPVYGVAPIVAATFQRGLALWFVGLPERARRHVRAGLDSVGTRTAPIDVASSHSHASIFGLIAGDRPFTRVHAERCLDVCREWDVAFFQTGAACCLAGADDEPDERSLAAQREAFAEHRARVGVFLCDLFLAAMIRTYARLGRWDEGLRCAEDGIEITRTSLERLYAAEMWRLRGEMLASKARARGRGRRGADAGSEVTESLTRALEIADDQGARMLALRARTSLVRHAANDTRRAVERDALAQLYATFTEGFDTPDLLDAKALLISARPAAPASDALA